MTVDTPVFMYAARGCGDNLEISIGELGLNELAVETGDVAQRDVLGALGGAGTGVGTVTEADFVHLADHGAGTTGTLHLTLGQEGELAYLGCDEEHGGAVLAGCNACAATDAGSGVHSLVSDLLGDGEVVGIGRTTAVERNVAACLLDFIEGVTVNHEVADNGEGSRTPGFDCDFIAILELTHVELAGGDTLNGAVGVSVDIERTHTADTFAAVIVEHHGLFTLVYELLVEHIEHFEERGAGGDVIEVILDELPGFLGPTLTPNLEVYANCSFHN